VGDDDGWEGDGTAGTEQHTVTAGKKPTLSVQGIFLAALLCGSGIADLLRQLHQKKTSRLCAELPQF